MSQFVFPLLSAMTQMSFDILCPLPVDNGQERVGHHITRKQTYEYINNNF